jgi:hypothetical protein
MAMLSFGGIDVSKHRLDVMLLPEGECASVSNDAAGWAKLVKQLRGSSIAASSATSIAATARACGAGSVVLPTSFMGVFWSVLAVEFPPAAVEALECAIEIGHTLNPVSNAIEATLQSVPWVDETKQTSGVCPEK